MWIKAKDNEKISQAERKKKTPKDWRKANKAVKKSGVDLLHIFFSIFTALPAQ